MPEAQPLGLRFDTVLLGRGLCASPFELKYVKGHGQIPESSHHLSAAAIAFLAFVLLKVHVSTVVHIVLHGRPRISDQ